MRLIREKRAVDVVLPDGSLAIELGNFGPRPCSPYVAALPPSELPNTIFKPPYPIQHRTCRLLVRITRGFWRSQIASA